MRPSTVLDSQVNEQSNWLPRFLRPPLPAPPLTDPDAIRRDYAYCRPRILVWTTLGYGMFYFVRKNLSMAMPVMLEQLHFSKSSLGLILTIHGLVYGVSKFLNGILADRANARIFMALALVISAALNVGFGLSSSLAFLGFFWMLNGWFQGMGYPPCARLLTHWFSPKELATKMSYWNASHQIGGGLITILCSLILSHSHNNWRLCFFIPAVIAAITSAALFLFLRDTPESVGLPEIDGTNLTRSEDSNNSAAFKKFLWDRVFSNKYIWLVSAANFFVYTIRFAIFDWGPTLLKQSKGIELHNAAWMVAGFEWAGLIGVLITAQITEKFFTGRGAPVSMISMLLCGLCVFFLWKAPGNRFWLNTTLMAATGFFIYGPQALAAVVVANLATKKAAASAVGLTSIFGYASTALSGWGIGKLTENYGWTPAFKGLLIVAALGALLFALALPAKAHGYDQSPQ